jgi:hypothetical protein
MSTEANSKTMSGREPFPGLHPIFADAVTEHHKFALGRPFVEGDHVIATDGRLFVRTPCEALGAGGLAPYWKDPGRKYPSQMAAGIAAQGPWDDEPTPIPDCVPFVRCETCAGSGCYVDSLGLARMDTECLDCDGSGWERNLERVYVGEFPFSAYLLALLRSHGVTGLRLSKNPPLQHAAKAGECKCGAAFAGDGFDGIVAPMTLEDS